MWRKYKRYQICEGSLILRTKKYRDYPFALCLVTSIGSYSLFNNTKRHFIIGHTVKMNKNYHKLDRNPLGKIEENIVCWSMEDVDYVVRYTHCCDNSCSLSHDNVKNHHWRGNKRIALFWYTGIGALKTIGEPIADFADAYEYNL